MGELVNLRARQKAKARADKERQAEENRTKFGRTLAERDRAKKLSNIEKKKLDSHLLKEPGTSSDEAET